MAFRSIRRILTALLFLTPALTQAAPQPQSRTFVSAKKGSDSANCGRTSPCRTFNRAISLTSPGGEVVVLDSGGYGAVTVSQAITLEAPEGVYAGMMVSSGDAVVINGGTNDVVFLRGLTIVGSATAGNGITIASAGAVHVEHCTIQGFSAGNGIAATQSLFQHLFVEDSKTSDCNVGLNVLPATGQQTERSSAVITRSRFDESQTAALLFLGEDNSPVQIAVEVSECVIAGDAGGIAAGQFVELVLDRTLIASHGIGAGHTDFEIFGPSSLAFITNSVIPNLYAGLRVGGTASVCLMGNNLISNVVGTTIDHCLPQ